MSANSPTDKIKASVLADRWHERVLGLMDRVNLFSMDIFSVVQACNTGPAGGCQPGTGSLQHRLPGKDKLVKALICFPMARSH